MTRHAPFRIVLPAALLCLIGFAVALPFASAEEMDGDADAPAFALFDADLAKELTLSEQDYADILRQAENRQNAMKSSGRAPDGPIIRFEIPEPVGLDPETPVPELRVTPPASLHVSFERKESDVDMDSLRIRAKRGIFSRDLTGRLAPYIDGTSIRADDIDVPTGTFNIEIRIDDVDGRRTEAEYFMVSER